MNDTENYSIDYKDTKAKCRLYWAPCSLRAETGGRRPVTWVSRAPSRCLCHLGHNIISFHHINTYRKIGLGLGIKIIPSQVLTGVWYFLALHKQQKYSAALNTGCANSSVWARIAPWQYCAMPEISLPSSLVCFLVGDPSQSRADSAWQLLYISNISSPCPVPTLAIVIYE